MLYILAVSLLLKANVTPLLAQPAAAPDPATTGDSQGTMGEEATAAGGMEGIQESWMRAYMGEDPASDALWLGDGEEPFVAFYTQAVGAKQMGLLLLADTPGELTGNSWQRYLYGQLPLHGWSAALALLPVAERQAGNEERAMRALKRSGAASRWILDQGARSFAILADGPSAGDAADACLASAETCSGLVLWRVAEQKLAALPLQKLQQSRVSLLDMLDGQPDGDTRLRRQRHIKAAGFQRDYRPVVLPVADNAASYALAVKRLRSWMDATFARE